MLAIALWHGLKWTFLVFGALNALYVMVPVLKRVCTGRPPSAIPERRHRWVGVVLTFHLMMLAFIFFRADDLAADARVLGGFGGLFQGDRHVSGVSAAVVLFRAAVPVATMALVEFGVARGYWSRWFEKPGVGAAGRWFVYYLALLAIIFLGVWETPDFIYARF